MPDFYELMFEVSNEERVRILRAVRTQRTSFSGLARTLDITTQEVSRHFNRLMDAGLSTRDGDGAPVLTPLGDIILRQLEAARFTVDHGEYFVNHRANLLPDTFISRMGELSSLNYREDIMVIIHDVVRIIQEAEEYLLDINLPYIASAFPHISDAYRRGVTGKFLHGKDLRLPDEMRGVRDESFTDNYVEEVRKIGVYEERFLDSEVMLYMNEKEVALLSFPNVNGHYDYAGFTGDSPSAHRWCTDLFNHLWVKGKLIR